MMTRNLKAILLIALAIVLSISAAAQSARDKGRDGHINPNELEKLRLELSKEICDFQDDEEFLYARGQAKASRQDMAMQMAMRCAQSELNRKISADERYNKNVTQGVSSFSEVCQKISMDEQGMYVCYIAIRVTRKDLENQTEELDSINVLQEK